MAALISVSIALSASQARTPDALTFEDLCNSADDELFTKIRTFPNHILHALLPPPSIASQNYSHSVHTHFSYLNVQHIFLTVIS